MVLHSTSGGFLLRYATDDDAPDLLRWRNMPHVRAAMINQDEIALEDHLKWWERAKVDPKKRFVIVEREGIALAVVNFFSIDEAERTGWWGFYLTDSGAETGGLPLWIDVESCALRFAFEVLDLKELLCETRSTNAPVLMLHERFGFETLPSEGFPNAVEHELIVKRMSAEIFASRKDDIVSENAREAALPGPNVLFSQDMSSSTRMVIVGSANWDEVVADMTEAQAVFTGQQFQCWAPPFGQGVMELLNPDSELRRIDPEYVVLAERFEDFFLPLDTPSEDTLQTIRDRFDDYLTNIRDIREGLSGHILVHDFAPIRPYLASFAEATANRGDIAQLVHEMNVQLAELCDELADCTLLPVARLIEDLGADAADPGKYWLMGRFPYGPKFTSAYHRLVAGAIMALTGHSARALVLDLDNTMWGGVVGDDGTFGLELGSDYPGNQFVAFQNFVKSISARGLILTVCSKNTEEVALAAFRDNPNMVVKEDDLIAHRINWIPKSQNIQEIANEIDLGLSSLMFIDDNPMEREEVRQNCPGVIVPEMPFDVSEWPRYLASHPALSAVQLIDQDRDRVKKYKIRAQVKKAEQSSTDRHSFLRKLGMGIEIAELTEATEARALQLFAKTNQFNTTTIRYSKTDLNKVLADGGDVLTVRITDKFGSDETIAVLVVTYAKGGAARIENFVMSCRVLGRGAETAILADVCKRALARGCLGLQGAVIETERNHPCRDVYSRHDFVDVGEGVFELSLETPTPFPDWFDYL